MLFQSGTAQLGTSTSDQVSAARNLLALQAWRHELKFKLVGTVPASCRTGVRCAEAQLLQTRVQTFLGVMERDWPAGANREALSKIVWGAGSGARRDEDADRIRIVLTSGAIGQAASSCPAEIQIADPEMPAMEDTDRAPWLNAAPGQPVAVSANARLRVIPRGPNMSSLILFSTPVTLLDGGTEAPVDRKVYGLDFAGQRLTVRMTEGADERTALEGATMSRNGDDRKVGDFVQTWTDPPAPSAGCTFRFERWVAGVTR
ncbi:hypothetical protein [Bradyrhizobium sp. 21]|uniref:hypothetical protein n=1 Tax=Bradyrhizobium sp. 21 TaxID=2782666 RepID=UPI001FFB2FA3|nr:hypothetical protein [Bradyrhizobium sp. 21]MCK1389024.1 hypothetical protein [Bradyrhizobium sp. 21]